MIRTVISLDEDDKRWLDRESARRGVTMTQMVRDAIRRMRAAPASSATSFDRLLEGTSGLWRQGDGLDPLEDRLVMARLAGTRVNGRMKDAPLAEALEYMDRVRQVSPLPVCAGFGIRSREQVGNLRGHVDGVIVGSALVEVLERGEDPAAYQRGLR